MEIIAKNEKGELARVGLNVDEDGDNNTGSVTFTCKAKLPLIARMGIKMLKNLDNREF